MTFLFRVKGLVAIQIDRVMKVGSVINTGLLVLNLSLLISQVWQWRGGPTWAWILGSTVVLSIGIVLFAHVWTGSLDMVRAMRKASAIHDPPQVYQLVPMQRVQWLNVDIPQLEALAAWHRYDGVDEVADSLEKQIEKLKRWESLGFIPREEYPPHLLHYYWHTEGEL